MAQKNIKDVKSKKDIKVKDVKKTEKKVEQKEKKVEHKPEVKTASAHLESKNSKFAQDVKSSSEKEADLTHAKKIQLSPQDAYRFFNEEKKKLENIATDLENTEQAVLELDKTIFALKEIKDAKEKDVMINLGMGLFIKAKLEDTKKVLAISAGKAVIPKDPAKVLEQLTKRKTSALDSIKRLQVLHSQTQQNLNQLYKYLTAHEQKMRQQSPQNRQ